MKKTPYMQALETFVASDEWKTSSDPSTLNAPLRMRTYLENRLKRAFDEGWKARGEGSASGEPHG